MANKELTARVKLDVRDAESKLRRLTERIKSINKVLDASGSNGLERKIDKTLIAQEKLKQATLKTKLAEERLTTQKSKSALATQKVNEATVKTQIAEQRLTAQTERTKAIVEKINSAKSKVDTKVTTIKTKMGEWLSKSKQILSSTKSTGGALGTVASKLKTIVGTYLGLQTAQLGINTADTITSAENKLNNIEGGSQSLTNESMEKAYAAAQRSRSAYSDMLSNVSKTMTLAGDSFQGNVDNAIRFQEIMAKAYTVGGASSTEASTSMYQLVQALGSGVLQGDELRSVREGAPIAYKKIEEFAQGVFKTEESLKDLASQGVITSDIIVAAIMSAEDDINKSFKNTKMTFAQALTSIKNVAMRAFQPVLQKITEVLNSDAGQKAVVSISNALVVLADVFGWLFTVMFNFINWCAENWSWLKYVIIGALILIISYTLLKAGISITCAILEVIAWLQVNWAMFVVLATIFIIIAAILGLIAVFYLWKTGAIDTCEAIVSALMIVGIAIAIIGLLAGSWITVIIGLVIAAIGLIVKYLDYFLGIVYSILSFIYNLVVGVLNGIIELVYDCIQPILSVIEFILNCCNGGFNSFGDGVANLIGQIISWFLSLGKVVTKIIDAIFGTDWTSGLESLRENVIAWGKNEEAITLTGEAPTVETFTGGALPDRISYSDAWNTGMNHGAIAKDAINDWGSQFQTMDGLGSMFDGLSDSSGTKLNLDDLTGVKGLPSADDPSLALGDAYDPAGANDDIAEGLKKLGNIEDNTDSIKDSMDLADDDLEYLRKIADMEWRNEFTTAEIKIDMTNNNTVNSDRDLDGIVDYLSDVLRTEMTSVANGVHY